ncbi:MAG TPA: PIN domain-containing protein [Mucilaginibacter sp.]|nr:PIN domain-containing protein [Mucilaginibacter sp.]
MKIVVDTNIIFSGLLNTNGAIGELLINSKNSFEFYSCNYMRFEIEKHREKIKKISKLSDLQLADAEFHLFSRLKFVNEDLIPKAVWEKAVKLTNDIDLDDTDFVALAIYLKGGLWTGDKELYNGLKRKKFKKVFNTADLNNLNNLF